MIYIGTCGFAYRDWIGSFYPPKTKPDEMLGYYARRFTAVEIDATYYGVLDRRSVQRMDARTPDGFRFSFKAPKSLTHAPGAAEAPSDELTRFIESLAPVAASGKLASVLLQFPPAFLPTPRNHDYLKRVAAWLRGVPLVAEFREAAWQTGETLALLRALHVGWCNLDMPSLESLLAPSTDATSPVGYVRFHGRNAERWLTGDRITRYAYAYSREELEPWRERLLAIAAHTQATYAFFNNHARGGAARDAATLESLLEARCPGEDNVLARAPGGNPEQRALPGFS
ncbi:MAG TPA: DUF72 domain-containing protein [Candidatus Dormibacteraeota bacterium]|nr:DUF72 domain-containing protein [Candidatus Dormibacteraeota bacterium]